MRIGFIGTGSMGSILVEAFLRSNAVEPTHLLLYNRTPAKAIRLAEQYPGIEVTPTLSELVHKSNLLFIAVRPKDYKEVLTETAPLMTPQKTLISITSGVMIEELEKRIPTGKVVKMIPSITNAALSGALLLMFGTRLDQIEKASLTAFLSHIGTPIEIKEEQVRVASDIASCGPAFFSFLLQDFIQNAVKETGIDERLATRLTGEMMIGLGKLLSTGLFTLPTLQERVCVPGGVTGAGLHVLEEKTKGLFKALFLTTQQKFKEDREEMKKILFLPNPFPSDNER